MPRTLLLLVLTIAILLEAALTGGAFFAPAFTLKQFGVLYGPDTRFLAYVLGWLLGLVTLLAGLALAWVARRRPGGVALCYLLGLWWVGIGVGIYLAFGKPDNLLLDSLKGLLLVVLARWLQISRQPLQR